MRKLSFHFFIAVMILVTISNYLPAQKKSKEPQSKLLETAFFKNLKARSIGPAMMGGRVSDIAMDPKDQFTFYVGLGTGGVMKTSDNGNSFSGIFEKESVAAIGAIAVAPSNAKYVWVGTGEANDRNSSSWGNGVYLSTDAGDTWKNIGLKESKTISRIVVHPTDSLTAYVAVMGDLWTFGGDRGLFKTTDAGKTWKNVLSAPVPYNTKVGCGDVVLDTTNPNIIYAALYGRQRTPWSFSYGTAVTDGKDLGGIFKSTDAGATWKKLEAGLPKLTGRIGLSLYRKNPKIVYAVVQSDEGGTSNIDDVKSKSGGVFLSTDAGENWARVNPLNPRPFYFSQIRVDPADSSRVYVLGYLLHVSLDGGKTFREEYFKNIHSDCHALAFDPKNSKHILLGTDGGVYMSYAGGKGWEFLNRFAGGEFYRIAVDTSTPYRIAGGLQDNLNWVGPSQTYSKEGIVNYDWTNIEGGDGFYCVFDSEDKNILYAESQEGYVHRFNLSNREVKGLRPQPTEGQTGFRFHWNSPLIPSTHTKGIMYLGGNRVFKFWDKGEKWSAISPDLSTQDSKKILTTGSGAENFGVVYALAESPIKAGLLWAGTDDGKLWITENEGGIWNDLTENLPKSIKGQWISRIEPSHFDAKVAYLAVDGHRTGNYSPLLLRTSDGGKSWTNISGNLPANGPVKVVREDLVNPELLFVGTEFGLFTSLDKGEHWIKVGELPTVAVDDIVIHPRERDLVIATHGRSLFILDDIRPLEELVDSVQTKDVHLFTPRNAFGTNLFSGWMESSGTTIFRGANPPQGALINYYIKEFTGEAVTIAISNSADQVVANLTGTNTPGVNRVVWELKMTKDLLTEYGGEGQFFVRPGEYTITLTYGKLTQKQKIKVDIAAGLETK
ncbi:MAG: hypothetical protein PHP42_03020 [Bacteroidota bacterium]|nr:hypothetical protein [Bacteroidota bacterium]